MEPIILEHIIQFASLTVIALFAVLYAKGKFITILPGVMLGALTARLFNLNLYTPLKSFSVLAAILIVFIAGLELDINYVYREGFRLGLQIFFEITLILSTILIMHTLLPYELAITLTVLILASTEAFALVATKNPNLRSLGITISVMEDSFAVTVLALGYLTSKSITIVPAVYGLIIGSITLLVIILFIAKPFNKVLDSIENIDTKIIITLLYLLLLSILSETTGIPDAFVVFIGGLALAIYGYDHATYKRMESYMYLALIGFIASLPFQINFILTPYMYIKALILGLIFSVTVFIIRSIILFISLYLSGFSLNNVLTLSLTLANTGEFGLIILAALMSRGIISPEYAYAAMFTYVINLTIESHIAKNIDRYKDKVYTIIPKFVWDRLLSWRLVINTAVEDLSIEGGFKYLLYQYIGLALITYLSTIILHFISYSFMEISIFIIESASLIVAVWVGVKHLYQRLPRVRISTRPFLILIELFITYIFIVPIIWSIETYIGKYGVESILNPIILTALAITTISILYLIKKLPLSSISYK